MPTTEAPTPEPDEPQPEPTGPDTASAAVRSEQEAKAGLFTRLYTGTGAFDVIGHRNRFFVASVVVVLICLGSVIFRGFNLGIDFEGGTQVQFPAGTATTEQVTTSYTDALGMPPVSVQTVGTGGSATIQLRSLSLDESQVETLKQQLFTDFQPVGTDGTASVNAISDSAVSSTWGGEITQKAIIALVVFLVLVTVFLAIRFERDMAIGALVSLFHDVFITAGVYSIIGFEVTPGTVIGLLTILGFSLYDTVVVFDKVRENVRDLRSSSSRTYSEAANLAVNQVLVRSINTTVIGVLPVAALLFAGAVILGEGPLKDLALALFVGMISGAYSSIFIATPLLAQVKERDPEMKKLASRVANRRTKEESRGRGVGAEGAPAVAARAIDPNALDDGVVDHDLQPVPALTVTRAAAGTVPVRPVSEGAARRPQPQHKPRSQRRK